jgi:hypothetical protein
MMSLSSPRECCLMFSKKPSITLKTISTMATHSHTLSIAKTAIHLRER